MSSMMRWVLPLVFATSMASAQGITGVACADGQVADGRGHCCWSGQRWSETRRACVGPARCPPGFARTGESCVATRCEGGRATSPDTSGHCCWAGQVWSSTRQTCVGVPQCPPELAAAGETCAPAPCDPGQARGPETAGRCCWPQQVWSAQRGVCVGVPACPEGYAAQGERCVAAPSCAEGQVVVDGACACPPGTATGPATEGHCCRPGEVWSPSLRSCAREAPAAAPVASPAEPVAAPLPVTPTVAGTPATPEAPATPTPATDRPAPAAPAPASSTGFHFSMAFGYYPSERPAYGFCTWLGFRLAGFGQERRTKLMLDLGLSFFYQEIEPNGPSTQLVMPAAVALGLVVPFASHFGFAVRGGLAGFLTSSDGVLTTTASGVASADLLLGPNLRGGPGATLGTDAYIGENGAAVILRVGMFR